MNRLGTGPYQAAIESAHTEPQEASRDTAPSIDLDRLQIKNRGRVGRAPRCFTVFQYCYGK
jgi:hypothetical protein